MPNPSPSCKVLIQNTDNPDDINKDEAVDIGLIGDVKLTLQAIIDEVKAQIGEPRNSDRVAAEIAQAKKQWLDTWTPLLTSNEEPLNPYRVINEINNTLDRENSIVTHDAGAPRDSIVPFYTATTPHSYIGWGKTTHLGFGIPLDDRRQTRSSRQILSQHDGRWRLRHVRPGHRNICPRRHSHYNRNPEQRGHGDIPRRISGSPRTLRRLQHAGQLRSNSRRHGRCGHHRQKSGRNAPRTTRSPAT